MKEKNKQSTQYDAYEMVIGLEVHVELSTKSKIFCGCSTTYGAPPNTQVCAVCLGFPGTLPVLNEQVVAYAAKAALALNCSINEWGRQDRKNYFYPDLPKAYQISQNEFPIGYKGHLNIETHDGEKKIGITRLHIEEDAGKLIHEGESGTRIDYNRGGVPLIEIVSEPDLRSADEVKAYLHKLRATLLYLEISSCKMNEGAFRCDVNLSVRKKGDLNLGTRTEMKNLNAFSHIVKAIEHESRRQIDLLESEGQVIQETRRWDANKGASTALRSKEDAHDYRYFPDPDLMPIVLTEAVVEKLRAEIPQLPDAYKRSFMTQFDIKPQVAEQLVKTRELAIFFETAAKCTEYPEVLSNLMVTEGFRLMGTEDDFGSFPDAEKVSQLADLIGAGKINLGIAKKVLNVVWERNLTPESILNDNDWWPIDSYEVIKAIGQEIIKEMPQITKDFLSGKSKAIGAFMGQMMKRTEGKADPDVSESVFYELINQYREDQQLN